MQTTFTELMQQLFLKLGLNHQVNENDVYTFTFEVDGHIQVLIACYHQQWVQLFSELGADLPTNDNLFGEHWPAHVQGRLDGKPILWSQQSLVGLNELPMHRNISSILHSIIIYFKATDIV
ncbi:CesT family type III secretion system chaperone [Yersinia pestis]|uniref:CesT family type III secretion system chaperone n=1 Tax=Yersinia pestis TaxID=632 RepID=UPI000ADC7C55